MQTGETRGFFCVEEAFYYATSHNWSRMKLLGISTNVTMFLHNFFGCLRIYIDSAHTCTEYRPWVLKAADTPVPYGRAACGRLPSRLAEIKGGA